DCGACAQLSLRMAVEAGVSRSLLETLVHRPDELPPLLVSVRDHVRRVLGVDAMDEDAAEALRSELGDAGFAELATCIVGSRIYPTLKKAMLATQTCQALHLDF
ncbi:MAG: hypothetical protein P1V35_04460, partial [Planctomycetota bacterium]|nr:hypothetical protein [Planctomycetota bacterium]